MWFSYNQIEYLSNERNKLIRHKLVVCLQNERLCKLSIRCFGVQCDTDAGRPLAVLGATDFERKKLPVNVSTYYLKIQVCRPSHGEFARHIPAAQHGAEVNLRNVVGFYLPLKSKIYRTPIRKLDLHIFRYLP
ncbi:MAG: hypothetical protein AMXMBFR4_10130 [Candidatus Hydrogenedentota bacterium]